MTSTYSAARQNFAIDVAIARTEDRTEQLAVLAASAGRSNNADVTAVQDENYSQIDRDAVVIVSHGVFIFS